jgi:hypothetical protein
MLRFSDDLKLWKLEVKETFVFHIKKTEQAVNRSVSSQRCVAVDKAQKMPFFYKHGICSSYNVFTNR